MQKEKKITNEEAEEIWDKKSTKIHHPSNLQPPRRLQNILPFVVGGG